MKIAVPQPLNRLLKNSAARRVAPSAAKAGTENKSFIAAVIRCATQKQNHLGPVVGQAWLRIATGSPRPKWLKKNTCGEVTWGNDKDLMMTDSIDLLCERCGQTFSAFLHEMAEQNEKVVCPNCRTSRDCKPAKPDKPVAGPRTVKKTN
ncbi:MAG: hypothetical protein WBQ43_21090 [Terriglobales bacterium]